MNSISIASTTSCKMTPQLPAKKFKSLADAFQLGLDPRLIPLTKFRPANSCTSSSLTKIPQPFFYSSHQRSHPHSRWQGAPSGLKGKISPLFNLSSTLPSHASQGMVLDSLEELKCRLSLRGRADLPPQKIVELIVKRPRLQSLDLAYTAVNDELLAQIAQHCPHLQEINLKHCQKLTDLSLSKLAKYCPHLKAINLAHTQMTAEGLKVLLQNCSPLSSLNIANCPFDGASFSQLLPYLYQLEMFNGSFCPQLGDKELLALMHSCPKLHSLNANGCRLTPLFLMVALGGNHALLKLSIKDCPHLSAQLIQAVTAARLLPIKTEVNF